MSLIKICGLTRGQDIEAVNEALPDYIGFVFAKSHREVTPRRAAELKGLLNPNIRAVGVFVNEMPNNIAELCRAGTIDLVQLHGDESLDYVDELRSLVANPIIRAVRVRGREDVEDMDNMPFEYLLFDAWDREMYGGSGRAFDWSLIGSIEKPFFLAGGLTPENLVRAASEVKPYCLDISSGVESDGYKDREKILKAVNAVRSVK